jgi:enterochelin esterase-like enzyme
MGSKLRFPRLFALVVIALLSAAERPAALAAPAAPVLASPRLQQLWEQIQAGTPEAEAKFFAGLTGGTPLIEPVAGDPASSLVTFLWQGKPETRRVAVSGGRPLGDIEAALERLPGTTLWFRSERLPSDARFTYSLSVDGAAEKPDRIEELIALPDTSAADPHNPRTVNGASYVVLPQAPPFPYPVNAAAPKGQVLDVSFHSKAMDGDFALKVYLPAKPAHPGPRPWLLVGLDAGFEDMGPVLDDLIASGKVPPLVAVGVVSRQGKRTKDLGYSDPFATFLAKELIPWARRQYGTSIRRAQTVLAGESRGAGQVLYTMLHHPDAAGKVLAISTALENTPGGYAPSRYWLDPQNGWLIERILETPRRPVELFMTVGRLDTNLWVDRVISSRRLRDVFRAQGYRIHYTESTGGHDALFFQRGYVEGLPVLTHPGKP